MVPCPPFLYFRNMKAPLYLKENAWSFWWPVIVAFAALTALFAALVSWSKGLQIDWTTFSQSKSALNGVYCERDRVAELVRQPSNSWSNLIYLFYGLVLIRFGLNDRKHFKQQAPNWLTTMPELSILFGLHLSLLCFGSFLFHASLTRMGQRWDMVGTYGVLVSPLITMIWAVVSIMLKGPEKLTDRSYLRKSVLPLIIAILLTDVFIYIIKWYLDGFTTMFSLMVAMLSVMIIYRVKAKGVMNLLFGVASILAIAFAWFLQVTDRQKIWCDPDSWLQGHAAWHAASGFAVVLLYLMIRSDKAIERAQDH